jgi:hypothetical protein
LLNGLQLHASDIQKISFLTYFFMKALGLLRGFGAARQVRFLQNVTFQDLSLKTLTQIIKHVPCEILLDLSAHKKLALEVF